MGNKQQEKKCLELVLHDKPSCQFGKEIQKLLKGEILERETPDFLINRMGIEHFLADMFFTTKKKNAMSTARKNSSKIIEAVSHYQNNAESLEKDVDNGKATEFIENIVNSQVDGIRNFKYQNFIENYKRQFNNHYENRNEYRKKCDKLGFLIEIPYISPCIGDYTITKGKRTYRQKVRTIPLSNNMFEYIWEHHDLDFVIFCIYPININKKTQPKEIAIVYIDPKNKNLFNQSIVLCDEFDYTIKLNKKLKLNVKP
ncbi:hypothetical protein [Beduinella massiliensis]|uniref:hypothetical protein n=1 Tax=Beduinella massiliensis TaxID=1852363 RepID=UPI000C853C49